MVTYEQLESDIPVMRWNLTLRSAKWAELFHKMKPGQSTVLKTANDAKAFFAHGRRLGNTMAMRKLWGADGIHTVGGWRVWLLKKRRAKAIKEPRKWGAPRHGKARQKRT